MPAQHRPNKPERPRGIGVTVSVSCFVPKPFTPFQWEKQDSFETLIEKQQHLKNSITDRRIKYAYHDAKVSRIEAVLARGAKVTGATVHFVDEGTDTGPILLQKAVYVQQDDTPETLQKRIMQEAEWVILPEAVKLFCEDRITVKNNKVYID